MHVETLHLEILHLKTLHLEPLASTGCSLSSKRLMHRIDSKMSRSFTSVLALAAALLLAVPSARADDAPAPVATDPVAPVTTDPATPAPTDPAAPAATDPATPAPTTPDATTPAASKTLGKTDPNDNTPVGSSGLHKEAHILIVRKDRAEGKSEISLSVPAQINGKFVTHFGLGLDYAYHLRETFALTAGGTWFYWNAQNSFTDNELLPKARQVPTASEALLMTWEAHGGFEIQPFYGKFAVFNSGVVQFGFYIGTGAGVAHTRVEIQSDDGTGHGRTFGDTGYRPMGLFNAGFRMFFNEHVALRLEVRDLIYSAAVTRINGCTYNDLIAIKGNQSSHVGSGCSASSFTNPVSDANIAAQQVTDPSSEVLNNLMVSLAFSVLF
jgi:outer membrane beta-barrel protein